MSNVLLIGSGGAGNKILDSFLSVIDTSVGLQSTYDGMFINSNVNEMSRLKHYTTYNSLAIGGGGTGRIPKKCKEQMKASKSKLINYFANKLPNYDYCYIINSSDGGWGNGSVSILANIIKQIRPDLPVNLCSTIPPFSSRKISLENTINLWSDILKLQGDIFSYDSDEERRENSKINSIIFIDNHKMKNEAEFNTKVSELLLNSMELGNGALDSNDVERVNCSCGYKVILELDDRITNFKSAISQAIEDSPFIMPTEIMTDKFYCTHLGGVLNEKIGFDTNIPMDIFNPIEFDKCDYGKKSVIVLGGCVNPSEHIEMVQEALDTLNNENIKNKPIGQTTFTPKTQQTKQKETKKEEINVLKLRATLDADFWDD